MCRIPAALCAVLFVLLLACAGKRSGEEQQIERLLTSSASFYIERGSAAVDSGRYQQALEHFREALALVPQEPIVHNNIGVAFFKMGELDSAIAAYQEALRLQPTYASCYVNLAAAYREAGNPAFALSAVQRALELDPLLSDGYILLASIYQDSGRLDDGIALYRKALQHNPDDALLHLNLGAQLFTRGLINEAIEEFERVLVLEPNSSRAHFNLGNAMARKCLFEAALEHYEMALRHDPEMVSPWNNIALVLMVQGRHREALRTLQRAHELDPEDGIVLFNISLTMERLDSLDLALQYINRAITKDSTEGRFFLHRGAVLQRLGRDRQAVRSLERAIELDPVLAQSYSNLGNHYLEQNRAGEALQTFERALEVYPDYINQIYFSQNENVSRGMAVRMAACGDASVVTRDLARVYNNLGQSHMILEQYDRAEKAFRRAVELQPQFILPLENLAALYQRLGQPQRARGALARARLNRSRFAFSSDSLARAEKLCREALGLDPGLAPAYAQLGLIHHRRGDSTASERAFALALDADPFNAGVHLAYGTVLSEADRWREAAHHLEQSVALDPDMEQAHQLLAEALMRLDRTDQARRHKARGRYLQGREMEMAGIWDQALELYRTAAELDSTQTLYTTAQGLIQAKKHFHQEALQLFEKSLSRNESDALARYGLGVVYGDHKEYGLAVRALKRAVELDPGLAEAHYVLAVNLYFTGDYDQSWHHVRRVQELGRVVKTEFIEELKRASGGGNP